MAKGENTGIWNKEGCFKSQCTIANGFTKEVWEIVRRRRVFEGSCRTDEEKVYIITNKRFKSIKNLNICRIDIW